MNMADGRYVALYEALMQRCGSVLSFDNSFGSPLPSIDARPIAQPADDGHIMFTEVRTMSGLPSAVSQSAAVMAGSVRIPLPDDIVGLLRAQSGQVGTHLTYILSSDLEKRALNVFVPDKGALARLVHVGFRGIDQPGTLATAAALLDKARVRVVTSVQRNELVDESTMCVWEVVAEDQAGCQTSPPATMQERREDLAVRLRALVEQDGELQARSSTAQLAVVPPRYRHPSDVASAEEAVDLWPASSALHLGLPRGAESSRYGLSAQRWPHREFRRLLDRIGVQFTDRSTRAAARQLLLAAHEGATRTNARPSIFLSYPKVARHLARVLMNDRDLRSHFHFVDYQAPDGTSKKVGARSRILECDYFLALWHPDVDGETSSLSPWSAWESGVAEAYGIPSHHLVSKRAGKRYTVYRIDSNYTAIPYGDDDRFATDVLPQVRRLLIDDWGSPVAPRSASRRRSAA
jgi:hypothetical protein